jgi:hypothetical protein
MKNALLLLPAAFMLICMQTAWGSEATPTTVQPVFKDSKGDTCDFEAEILALDEIFRDAVVAADDATLEDLYSEDFVYTNPSGGVLNKTQAIASSEHSVLNIERIDLLNRVVRLHGTAAVITGDRVLVNAFFRPPGYPASLPPLNISGTYRYTHTFMQTSFGPSTAIHRACSSTWQLVSQNLTGIGWTRPASP